MRKLLEILLQQQDSSLKSYNPLGIKLIDGYIELVEKEDPLSWAFKANTNDSRESLKK